MPALMNLERRITPEDEAMLDRLMEEKSEVVEVLRSESSDYRYVAHGATILGTMLFGLGTFLLFNDGQPFDIGASYVLSAASYFGALSIGRMGSGISEYAGKLQGEANPLVIVLQ